MAAPESDVALWFKYSFCFIFICFGSKLLGGYFSPRLRFPMIICNLLVGVIVGPHVLGILGSPSFPYLRWILEVGQAFSGLCVGTELFVPELRENLRGIVHTSHSIITLTLLVCVPVTFGLSLTPLMPWNTTSLACTASFSFVLATIMCARSPTAATAIARDLKASGPATRTMLGVTLYGDVVALFAFAVANSVALTVCSSGRADDTTFGLLFFGVFTSLGLGLLFGGILLVLVELTWYPGFRRSNWFVVPFGWGIVHLFEWVCSALSESAGQPVFVEPMLICCIGGALCTNLSQRRKKFQTTLRWATPYVFISFFTLTGMMLSVPVLGQSLAFGAILFLVRAICVVIGSYLGGKVSGFPESQLRYQWMNLITQAGLSLALSSRAMVLFFDSWGLDFNTVVVSEILISEALGSSVAHTSLIVLGEAGQKNLEDNEQMLVSGEEITALSPTVLSPASSSSHVLSLMETSAPKITLSPSPSPMTTQPRMSPDSGRTRRASVASSPPEGRKRGLSLSRIPTPVTFLERPRFGKRSSMRKRLHAPTPRSVMFTPPESDFQYDVNIIPFKSEEILPSDCVSSALVLHASNLSVSVIRELVAKKCPWTCLMDTSIPVGNKQDVLESLPRGKFKFLRVAKAKDANGGGGLLDWVLFELGVWNLALEYELILLAFPDDETNFRALQILKKRYKYSMFIVLIKNYAQWGQLVKQEGAWALDKTFLKLETIMGLTNFIKMHEEVRETLFGELDTPEENMREDTFVQPTSRWSFRQLLEPAETAHGYAGY